MTNPLGKDTCMFVWESPCCEMLSYRGVEDDQDQEGEPEEQAYYTKEVRLKQNIK